MTRLRPDGLGVGVVGRIRGRTALFKRMGKLAGTDMERTLGKALFAAGEAIQVEAQISITAGAVSGRNHQPSKPGEAPNADTHFLANNIETHQQEPLRVRVESNAPYSEALEYGTSRMAARPFMQPAQDATRGEVNKLLDDAIKAVIRRSRSTD